jgi:hypothetical protein
MPAPWRKGGNVMRGTILGIALAGLVALLLAPTSALGADPPPLDLSLCAPGQNTFSLAIDNTYFPLPVGQQWVYFGKEQGDPIGLRITVLDDTETFHFRKLKVTTRVVEETEWADENENGLIDEGEDLIEVSLNYYAQTQEGTVCYFGEDVDIYEDGVVVSHEGAWRADDRGNAPGIFMPADPQEGMTFQQEVAPGVAEDTATIIRTGETVTVPAGTFTGAITVRDFNPLDGSRGTKVYAPDVGLVVDGPLELTSY